MKCKHLNTIKGEEIELRYGSHCTEICNDCNQWRIMGHNGNILSSWKVEGYEEAIQKEDDE